MDTIFDPLEKDFSPYIVAKNTLTLIMKILIQEKFKKLEEVIKLLRTLKKEIRKLCPLQYITDNIIKRIQLFIADQIQQLGDAKLRSKRK